MKRFILIILAFFSCAGIFGQRVTGAVIDEVKVVKKNPTGFLVLRVSPSNATVLIDGIRWNGSDQVKLDVGAHTVYVEAEKYTPQTKDFVIEKNKTCLLEISLSNTDKIMIGTNVPSLRKIDGFNYPEMLTAEYEMTYGKHTIELSAEGYLPLQKTIEVKNNGKNAFYFNLQEAPKQPDSDHMDVTIETNVICDRALDGVEMGQSQSQSYPMTWGEHTMTLNAEGYYPLKTKLNIVYQGKSKYHYDLVKQRTGMRGTHEIGIIAGGLNGISYKYWFTENLSLQGDLAVGLTYHKYLEYQESQQYYNYSYNYYWERWKTIDAYYRFPSIFDFTLNPNVAYNFALPKNFYFYVGGGVSLGFLSNLHSMKRSANAEYKERVIMGKFGINAMIGTEYIFGNIPLSLAFDFRPGYGLAFGYGNEQNYFDWKIAVSLRYTLKK